MLDVLITQINMANLNSRIQVWAKAAGVSLAEALQKQAGLLKWELMAGAPPRNLARSKKEATKDAKATFFPKPLDDFKGSKAQGKGIIWLYAANQPARVLVGVDSQDYQPQATPEQMKKLHAASRKNFRGAAWHTVGQRGKANPFKVLKLNRTVVGRGRLRSFIKDLQNNFGKLKAAWVVDHGRFNIARAIPQWVSKHVTSGKARGATLIQLGGPKPFIKIISRAHGVEHKASVQNVRRTVKKRLGAMLADMRLHLRGVKKKAGFKAA